MPKNRLGDAQLPLKGLCVGSAACVHADLKSAAELGVSQEAGWTIIAVNHIARDWPGPLDHWASFHAELFTRWIRERELSGRPAAGQLWTAERRAVVPNAPIMTAANWGGSSGLLAVCVALRLQCTHIVCAGIPLDYEQGHYDSPGKKWRDGSHYRAGWSSNKTRMANVRSMSGWTSALLGKPTAEWLAS